MWIYWRERNDLDKDTFGTKKERYKIFLKFIALMKLLTLFYYAFLLYLTEQDLQGIDPANASFVPIVQSLLVTSLLPVLCYTGSLLMGIGIPFSKISTGDPMVFNTVLFLGGICGVLNLGVGAYGAYIFYCTPAYNYCFFRFCCFLVLTLDYLWTILFDLPVILMYKKIT